MAKTLKEENLRLNIIVNGDPARKEILQLTRNSRDLRAENERLRAEQKKLRQRSPGKAAPIPNETDLDDDLRIESETRRTAECHAQRRTRNAPMATTAKRIAGRFEPHGATSR